MKSHFSRFLHYTLSYLGGKPDTNSSLSYSGLTRISRWDKFATLFDLDTPIKSECDSLGKNASAGRSMVEMLGVLAIIGVLSVGAIAGYSKAMSKYKLNKHMESFNILLNEAIKLLPELQRTYGKNTNSGHSLGSFFHKANLLPDGMTYNQQDNFIYDIFKNKTYITYSRTTAISNSGNISHPTIYYLNIYMNRSGTKISNLDNEICRNVFLACKENAENIDSVEMRSLKTDSYVAPSLSGNRLRNATLKQIDDVCSSCDSEIGCNIILYISVVKE